MVIVSCLFKIEISVDSSRVTYLTPFNKFQLVCWTQEHIYDEGDFNFFIVEP